MKKKDKDDKINQIDCLICIEVDGDQAMVWGGKDEKTLIFHESFDTKKQS
jgi:hypothetical protein